MSTYLIVLIVMLAVSVGLAIFAEAAKRRHPSWLRPLYISALLMAVLAILIQLTRLS